MKRSLIFNFIFLVLILKNAFCLQNDLEEHNEKIIYPCKTFQTANISVANSMYTNFSIDFLWWTPYQEQMEYAATSFGTNSALIREIHKLDFDGKAGLKAKLSLFICPIDLAINLQYTQLKKTTKASTILRTAINETLYNLWINQKPSSYTAREETAKWTIDFNVIDLTFSKAYYNGKKLILNSGYGLKSGWIHQNFKTTEKDTLSALQIESNYKLGSWFLGPYIQINSKWLISNNFYLFNKSGLSSFFQRFYKAFVKEPLVSGDSTTYYSSFFYKNAKLNYNVESILGLGWAKNLGKNEWNVDLSAGYELQIYFNQNLMRYLNNISSDLSNAAVINNHIQGAPFSKLGNLVFQGLTLQLKLEF